MSINMYAASVPVFVRKLGSLSNWLDKAEAHAQAKKFDASVYLAARLAPDMLPFTKQVQIACDGAKFCVARLAGVDAPKDDDSEATVAQLKARIAKTLAFIQSVPEAQIVGTDDKDISVPRRDGVMVMKGEPYLNHYALPNFYFHVTTAYALLRHNGVELGKSDYLA
jgi:hypothetical protein